MRIPVSAPLAGFVLMLAAAASGQEPDPLEKALGRPAATGLLVLRVAPDGQAAAAGVRKGDILVSYAGAAVVRRDALAGAMHAAAERETVECVLVGPDGARRTVSVRPGTMGVSVAEVKKGVPLAPLPPATVAEFDFSALEGTTLDEWADFTLDKKTKCGFEHGLLLLEGDTLVSRREVGFDGGEQWGTNHFDVTVIHRVRPRLEPVSVTFLNPLTGWVSRGRAVDGAWRIESRAPGKEAETRTVGLPDDLPVVPSYLVESLVRFLPREKNACFHFRPLDEGSAEVGLPAALLAVGEEEVDHAGNRVRAWRVEQRRLGGATVSIYWLDESGRTLRVDYGGAVGLASTREAALKGLPAGLQPRTDDDPHRLKPHHAPTPYSAEQIRDACRPGRVSSFRLEVPGRPAIVQTFRWTAGDAVHAEFEVSLKSAAGDGVVAPARTTRSTWKELQAHASFPAADTRITKGRLTTPAGEFDCVIYTVTAREESRTTVSTYHFAKKLPGPPVKFVQTVDGEPVLTMTLVEQRP